MSTPSSPPPVTYDKDGAALLVIDPYNDFISEGGKVWGRLKAVAEANGCVTHMSQVLEAARKVGLRIFYALHRRYRPGDYETWKHIAPVQRAAWLRRTFEYGTWGGEIRSEFVHWGPKKLETFPTATVPGTLHDVDFMVKDSQRFADGGGWGYDAFKYNAASGKFMPADTNDMPPQGNDAKCGVGCHTIVKGRDYVFTDYQKR